MTIKDVARASGVSQSTVSFVLNDTPGQTLRPETRERVRTAARQLGYAPHGIARALREGTSRVVLLDLGSLSAGPSLEGFVDGMREELAHHGYVLLITRGQDDDALRDVARAVEPRTVVHIARPFGTEDLAHPDGGWVHGLASHSVTQLRHLLDRGHRHIAFAVPETRMPDHVDARREHVRRAAATLGLPEPNLLVVPDDPTAARVAVAGLLAGAPRTSAIAAFDDDVALHILAAMTDLGLAAPEDLAVIGFDASRHGELWRPALTTVRIDASGYGRRAARVALGLADTPWPARPSHVVVRDSA